MRILLTIILLSQSLLSIASDDLFDRRTGTAIGQISLYSDSSFLKPANINFEEGQLFEVIGESQLEHEDNAQNQKFKWYQVQTTEGQKGWVFGDGIAVIVPDAQVEDLLKPFHKKKRRFNNGFEVSRIWVAAVEGRDNFHSQDFMNPIYSEQYIVITNDRNRSVHIKYGGVSAMGETKLRRFELHDISGDHIPELVLLSSSTTQNNPVENRNFSIHSFQAGTLEKVLEERMTLTYSNDEPSPALFKHIEIEGQSIRVEYVDYVNCSEYTLSHDFDVKSSKKERCLEYITYTYIWDERVNSFRLLYEKSHSPPIAGVRNIGLALQKAPKLSAARGSVVAINQPIEIIKHYEKFILERGVKKIESYFYVHLGAGEYGYLPAKFVGLVDIKHANLLNQYYSNTPLAKSEWTSPDDFFEIITQPVDSVTTDH